MRPSRVLLHPNVNAARDAKVELGDNYQSLSRRVS
jgi:hypothetical protein